MHPQCLFPTFSSCLQTRLHFRPSDHPKLLLKAMLYWRPNSKSEGSQKLHVQNLYNVPYMVKPAKQKKGGHRHTCDATQKDLYKLHLKWYSFHKTMANISLFYGKISEVLKSPFFPPSIILHPKQSRVSGQDR